VPKKSEHVLKQNNISTIYIIITTVYITLQKK